MKKILAIPSVVLVVVILIITTILGSGCGGGKKYDDPFFQDKIQVDPTSVQVGFTGFQVEVEVISAENLGINPVIVVLAPEPARDALGLIDGGGVPNRVRIGKLKRSAPDDGVGSGPIELNTLMTADPKYDWKFAATAVYSFKIAHYNEADQISPIDIYVLLYNKDFKEVARAHVVLESDYPGKMTVKTKEQTVPLKSGPPKTGAEDTTTIVEPAGPACQSPPDLGPNEVWLVGECATRSQYADYNNGVKYETVGSKIINISEYVAGPGLPTDTPKSVFVLESLSEGCQAEGPCLGSVVKDCVVGGRMEVYGLMFMLEGRQTISISEVMGGGDFCNFGEAGQGVGGHLTTCPSRFYFSRYCDR